VVATTVLKPIKPGKFKDAEARRVFRNALRRCAREIHKDFEATVATWETKVTFKEHTSLRQDEDAVSVTVDTGNEIYGYVNDGTRPHEIWAGYYTGKSDKKALAFPSIYSPKTEPGVIGSKSGGGSGDTVFSPFVRHPGTEGRHFDVAIREKRQPWFKHEMEQALHEVAVASGHRLAK